MKILIGLLFVCFGAFAATITPTLSRNTTVVTDSAKTITWSHISSGDTSTAIEVTGGREMTFQVTGTFTGSPTLTLHGSNDGTNFYSLNDKAAATVAFTSAGLKSVRDLPRYIKPVITSGSASSDLTGTIYILK